MPPSQPRRSTAQMYEDYLPLLEVLHVALMTREVEFAYSEIREGPVDSATKNSRSALAGSFLTLFAEPIGLAKADVVALREELSRSRGEVAGLKAELESLVKRLDCEDLRAFLKPHAKFLDRLENDHPKEKAAIARHVAKTYFEKENFRCFVQASTLAIPLGQEIAARGTAGVLIYTNSVPFPLTILRDGSGQFVYSFCGGEYDAVCAGWLFSRRDTRTRDELRRLFARSEDRLTAAVVMPLLVTADGKLHFRRDETAFLVEELGALADQLIVLAVGDRLAVTSHRTDLSCYTLPAVTPQKSIEVITGGAPTNGIGKEEVLGPLRERGVGATWLDCEVDLSPP